MLVVIHPKAITDATQYAIDQFVLRGGKLLAFLDPMAVLDPGWVRGCWPPPSKSALDKLLKAWGLSFEDPRVADMNYVARTRQGRAPALLALKKAMNKEDIVDCRRR